MKKKIIFLGNYNFIKNQDDTIKDVNAATIKIFNLIKNLKKKKYSIYLISSPTVKNLYKKNTVQRYYSTNILHRNFNSTIIRKIYANFFYFNLIRRLIKKNKKLNIFFYNALPEYFFTILYCRIKNIEITLDVEDSPRKDEFNLNAITNSIFFLIYHKIFFVNFLCTNIVNYNKFKKFNKKILYYGCVDRINKKDFYRKNKILVLFSGTINFDTGIDIFIEAVKKLNSNKEYQNINHRLEFIITGTIENINSLDSISKFNNVIIKTNLKYNQYLETLSKIDIGLNLRDPNSSINDSTFPSKIVEFLKYKIHIISSQNKDLNNFNLNNTIFLMENYESSELINLFRNYIYMIDRNQLSYDDQIITKIFNINNFAKFL